MFVITETGWFDLDFLKSRPGRVQATPKMGGTLLPRYIILHASGTTTLETELSLIQDTSLAYSMHLVVDRDGTIIQCVPFLKQAWHCGKSRWGQLQGLNGYAIGIEMINAGRLRQVGGRYHTWWGRKIAPADIYTDTQGVPWHAYTQTQILTVLAICRTLCAHYPIEDVLCRDDVSTAATPSMGEAWPMVEFQRVLSDRREDIAHPFITCQLTTIHAVPDLSSPQYDTPLLTGTMVIQEGSAPGGWVMVAAQSWRGQELDPQAGWVRRNALEYFSPPDDDIRPQLNGVHPPDDIWDDDDDDDHEASY